MIFKVTFAKWSFIVNGDLIENWNNPAVADNVKWLPVVIAIPVPRWVIESIEVSWGLHNRMNFTQCRIIFISHKSNVFPFYLLHATTLNLICPNEVVCEMEMTMRIMMITKRMSHTFAVSGGAWAKIYQRLVVSFSSILKKDIGRNRRLI